MSVWQVLLFDLGRVGLGLVYFLSALIDLRARKQLFQLMKVKKVPFHWVFFSGAVAWKLITSLLIIVNFYTAIAAVLLAVYILVANLIFNNFWKSGPEQRDFSLYLFLTYLGSSCGLLVIAGVS